ncbi:MAG: hypothetical protein KAU27_16150, partial [Desulfuromonadales bacterium]|nr:hypothetical protein [Desulfuromonadales bacterium]
MSTRKVKIFSFSSLAFQPSSPSLQQPYRESSKPPSHQQHKQNQTVSCLVIGNHLKPQLLGAQHAQRSA